MCGAVAEWAKALADLQLTVGLWVRFSVPTVCRLVAYQPLGKAALLAKYTHRSGLLSLLPSAGMANEHRTVVIQYWEGVYDVARINRTYMGQFL